MSGLTTPRTRLRRLSPADLANMIELESEPEIMKFTGMRVAQTPEQTERRLWAQLEKESALAPMGIWVAELKDGSFVGWFMLLPTRQELPELGFMTVKRQWGKGLATEVAGALVEFGLRDLGLKGIIATTNLDNFVSKRVLEKLGFRFQRQISVLDKVSGGQTSLDLFELRAP